MELCLMVSTSPLCVCMCVWWPGGLVMEHKYQYTCNLYCIQNCIKSVQPLYNCNYKDKLANIFISQISTFDDTIGLMRPLE